MKTLAIFIFSGVFTFILGEANAGILEDKKCDSCHRLNAEETGKNFAGPDLYYAGNKFQPEWLNTFLKQPEVIRPARFITNPRSLKSDPENPLPHPSFSEDEANALTKELLDLKIAEQTSVTPEPLSKGQRAKIKYQFERTFSCVSCHQSLNLAGKVRGGVSGPSLVNAGNRLQAKWVADWLSTPEAYTVKRRMPRYKMDADTLDQFTRFLMMLKKENIK